MAGRLARLNGWQRLWLVGTVCLGLWFMALWPLMEVGRVRSGDRIYRSAIQRDLDNPNCQDYQVRRLSELREPAYETEGGTCWHLYTSRKHDEFAAVPFTIEAYDRMQAAHERDFFLKVFGVGSVATILISGLVYLIGWIIAWKMGGFRQHSTPDD